MEHLPKNLQKKLTKLATTLIDQKRARTLVEPNEDKPGFWFGGDNAVRDPHSGDLLLIGRYRDAGDSRSGLSQGPRGRELAIFRSTDNGRTFTKTHSWDKTNLYCGSAVLSIEGSALQVGSRKVEVLVSSEKVRTYPRRFTQHLGLRLSCAARMQPWRIRFFATRFHLGRGRHPHHLPPTRAAHQRLCPSASPVALFLRWRRVPAPIGTTPTRGTAAPGLFLRGSGRTGLRL